MALRMIYSLPTAHVGSTQIFIKVGFPEETVYKVKPPVFHIQVGAVLERGVGSTTIKSLMSHHLCYIITHLTLQKPNVLARVRGGRAFGKPLITGQGRNGGHLVGGCSLVLRWWDVWPGAGLESF